jgi:hypothetical protein
MTDLTPAAAMSAQIVARPVSTPFRLMQGASTSPAAGVADKPENGFEHQGGGPRELHGPAV